MCERCRWARGDLLIDYHDNEWGVPVRDDPKLFEMLLLEGFQAGLSWQVVLSKREHFRRAFDGFDACKVAAFPAERIDALLQDSGLIRCRGKLEAAVTNARVFLEIQQAFGSFSAYLDTFTGGQILANQNHQLSWWYAPRLQGDNTGRA